MQIQQPQINNASFGERYVVKGNRKEIVSFMNKIDQYVLDSDQSGSMMLNFNPDIILISTDKSSCAAINVIHSKFYSSLPFSSFLQLSLKDKLKKIFGDDAENVKQYSAKEALNSKFDIIDGVIK